MKTGKFGLRILFNDGKKDFEWFVEEKLRDSEYKRYKRNRFVSTVRKVSRK